MELIDHYKAVRARLNAGSPRLKPPPPKPPPPPPEPPPPPLDLAELMAAAHALLDVPEGPRWKQILRAHAQASGYMVEQLTGSSRAMALTASRHELCYRLRVEGGYSLPRIGQILGGRDHTTILAGVRRHAERHGLPLPPQQPRKQKTGWNPMQRSGNL